jgi:3-dehydroquinate synthetase
VLCDPRALETLARRELRSGFGEALKYGVIRPALLERMASCARTGIANAGLVADCARVKVEVVEADPKERAERKLLNLGHTFGHGVEAAGGFSRYRHGEAIAVGLAFAFRLARRLGRVGDDAVERVEQALRSAKLPVRIPAPVARRALALTAHDKKRAASGLLWVLPRATGEAWQVEWDIEATADAVRDAVREIGGAE